MLYDRMLLLLLLFLLLLFLLMLELMVQVSTKQSLHSDGGVLLSEKTLFYDVNLFYFAIYFTYVIGIFRLNEHFFSQS
jgi:hypothetical protein